MYRYATQAYMYLNINTIVTDQNQLCKAITPTTAILKALYEVIYNKRQFRIIYLWSISVPHTRYLLRYLPYLRLMVCLPMCPECVAMATSLVELTMFISTFHFGTFAIELK